MSASTQKKTYSGTTEPYAVFYVTDEGVMSVKKVTAESPDQAEEYVNSAAPDSCWACSVVGLREMAEQLESGEGAVVEIDGILFDTYFDEEVIL